VLAPPALASEEIAKTVGAWTGACHQTEAGARECQVRNDEEGKPALEQSRLVSLTLHDGRNEAEGLVRIADLELPPRLEVELAFGAEMVTIEGVGRRGRLAARFSMPKQELAKLAAADGIAVRFADQKGQPHEVRVSTDGLADALALADDFL
jgi:invasion protein IalB